MEDSVETIIYIVITIIAIVASVYRNKAKKEQTAPKNIFFPDLEMDTEPEYEQQRENPTEEYLSPLEEILLGKQPEPEIYKEPEIISEPESKQIEGEAVFEETKNLLISDDISHEGSAEVSAEESGDMSEEISKYKFYDYNAIKDTEEDVTERDFDLKKAVIYSEILNRKYF
ncbi:MAG: hypothetical protein JXJ22_14800 [Bacteroidales bacterium]|nr:hypothetical protein [Bacteroidales bacterium]